MAHNQSFAIQWSKEVFYSFVFPQELFCSKCIEVGDVTRESANVQRSGSVINKRLDDWIVGKMSSFTFHLICSVRYDRSK